MVETIALYPPSVLVTGRPATDQSGYLESLGWSRFFDEQLAVDEARLSPSRIDAVHRGRLTALTAAGQVDLVPPSHSDTVDYAVGDWVLADPVSHTLNGRLNRPTLLQRRGEGSRPTRLVAANVDTLFIVASCNSDFNIARLERYLALANDAGATRNDAFHLGAVAGRGTLAPRANESYAPAGGKPKRPKPKKSTPDDPSFLFGPSLPAE